MPVDPKALIYVTAVVVALLALWVAYVLAKTPTRKDLTPKLAPTGPVVKRVVVKAPKKPAPVAEKAPPPEEAPVVADKSTDEPAGEEDDEDDADAEKA